MAPPPSRLAPACLDALRCLRCGGCLEVAGPAVRCVGCGEVVSRRGNYLDFLPQTDPGLLRSAQLDYAWDPATDYRITPFTRARWALLASLGLELARRLAWDGARVLSLSGGLAFPQASAYLLLDPSAWQLARRDPASPNSLAVRGLGEQLPVADAWADLVELDAVLDHVVEPARVLAEVARVLRPGGVACISLTNSESWYRRVAAWVGYHPASADAHRHRFSPARLRRLVEQAGLEPLASRSVGYVRLPLALEHALGRATPELVREWAVRWTDALLRPLLGQEAGGMLFVAARRPGARGDGAAFRLTDSAPW